MNAFKLTLAAFAALSISAYAQSFVSGNLAVLRVGNGVETLSANGNSAFIDQYTTSGGYVNSVNVPNTGSGSVVLGGNRTAEGWLALSPDRRYLTFAGYNSLPGAVNIQTSSGTAVPRVVGQIDSDRNFSIAASTTVGFSAVSFRAALTDGSGNYWGVGSSSSGGPYYMAPGTPAYLQSTYQTMRAAGIFNGNLYFGHTGSAGSGPGIYGFSGMPTAAATPTLFLGTGASAGTDEFEINSAGTVAYIADDRAATSGGGIQKWTFDGTSWSLAYTILSGGVNGARGLAVDWSGLNPVVYATTGESTGGTANKLVSYIDIGVTGTATLLAAASTGTFFRGLEFVPVPEPSGFALLGLGVAGLWVIRRRNP